MQKHRIIDLSIFGPIYFNKKKLKTLLDGKVFLEHLVERLYYIQVEQLVLQIGIEDDQFGQRLKAYVVLRENDTLTEYELRDWLRLRVSRYQAPKEIEFVQFLLYTPLGKLDKNQLYIINSKSRI